MMLNSTTSLVSAQRIPGSTQSLRVAGPKKSFGGKICGSRGLVVRAEGAGTSRVPDFIGWEEKEDYLSFKLSKIEKNSAEFGGLRYQLIDPDHLIIELDMGQSDDTIRTEKFNLAKEKD